jgi:hypothetical protein
MHKIYLLEIDEVIRERDFRSKNIFVLQFMFLLFELLSLNVAQSLVTYLAKLVDMSFL